VCLCACVHNLAYVHNVAYGDVATSVHVRTHARMHTRTQSRTHARTHARTHVHMKRPPLRFCECRCRCILCIYVCVCVCMRGCVCVCVCNEYACPHGRKTCARACIYGSVCIYACMLVRGPLRHHGARARESMHARRVCMSAGVAPLHIHLFFSFPQSHVSRHT
jgi:hypothetical protein